MADSKEQAGTDGSSAEDGGFVSLEGLGDESSGGNSGGEETAGPAEGASSSDDGEDSAFEHYQASKDEVDQFLAEEEGEFLGSLKDLKKISSEGVEIEPEEIDPSLLREEKEGRWGLLLQKLAPLFVPYYFFKSSIERAWLRLKGSGKFSKDFLLYLKGEGLKIATEKTKKAMEAGKTPLIRFWHAAKTVSWKGRLLFLGFLAVVVVLGVFSPVLYKGHFLPDAERQEIASFDEVAGETVEADLAAGLEPFDSQLRHPEYVVLLKRVVVNLKRPFRSSANPMGLFEFYVEAANQEAAVEIRQREPELLDILQRTVEAMTYRELNSVEGKQRMKVAIRRDLNQVMTKGRVKRVYIKTMTLKP